jgi:hypothetical protein
MSTGDEEPTFFKAPPNQPLTNPEMTQLALNVRKSLHDAFTHLINLPTFPEDRDRCVWMWHTSLATLAWDVADIAIGVSAVSNSMRTARALNRMLLEYAARVHLYIADPALAEQHVAEAPNMLRRVMKPAAAAAEDDPALEDVRTLIESGTTKASQPRTHDMFVAMVAHFVADPAERGAFVDYLDAEYALGSAYVHGSQASFFDIFDGGENQLHPRTRTLHRQAELVRCIACMIALLAGLEQHYKRDYGASVHVAALQTFGPFRKTQSMAMHDAVRLLLGIA